MPNYSAKSYNPQDINYMTLALKQAHLALQCGEVPVGAVLVKNNDVISVAYNKKESGPSSTYHAELIAIEKASLKLKNWRLTDCTLYVTLEPCIMCSGALIAARVSRLVYGAIDPKGGGIQSIYAIANNPKLNHQIDTIGGVLEESCSKILKDFFRSRRG